MVKLISLSISIFVLSSFFFIKKANALLPKSNLIKISFEYNKKEILKIEKQKFKLIKPIPSLLLWGISLLSISYAISLSIGATGYSIASKLQDNGTAFDFGILMVPFLGPFLSSTFISSKTPNYIIPSILGVVQFLGAIFISIGIYMMIKRNKKIEFLPYVKKNSLGFLMKATF